MAARGEYVSFDISCMIDIIALFKMPFKGQPVTFALFKMPFKDQSVIITLLKMLLKDQAYIHNTQLTSPFTQFNGIYDVLQRVGSARRQPSSTCSMPCVDSRPIWPGESTLH